MVNQDTFTGASFSLKNRLGRVLWLIVEFALFKYSPKPMHGWRSFLLICFGAKVGKGVHVYPKVKIWGPVEPGPWRRMRHSQRRCFIFAGKNKNWLPVCNISGR